ncbi:hypothetical protein CXB51_016716 [Gossypium anomalum]|uniref:Aminotransferase-like plant mobile domain-containing protein n=1 Tax=Gossypium anomalum TaxID=47600 RepID=A0A8J5YRC1_9ROSI|nr:hypothetical protein CXB51_016716 [Gossypium anomalum]
MGTVSLSIFTSSSEPPIYILTNNEFQWTPYEDPTIRAVIPNEFFQNLNIWHVKIPLVNYAIVEIHQSDRVLRQFRFRQSIPVEPEVLDDEHKVDLRLLNTDWLKHWSEYIEMWENRIHDKPYLLSKEERRRQICVQRERRGPLNLRRRDDDASPSAASTQSPGPSTAPTQLSGPTLQPMTPISQPFQIIPGAYPSPYMYLNPFMFPFLSPMAG